MKLTPEKMNNEQKHKTTSSIVSIACSTLNTEIITTTSTTTTPTTSIAPQTSVHHHNSSPSASVPTSSSTSSKSSTSLSLAPPPTPPAAVSKSANHASTHVSPMSDAFATGQLRGNSAPQKDVPINTATDGAASTPALGSGTSTPKVAATEETNNCISGTNVDKTKKTETWEECRLRDWDDSRLKNLLEEAYSYKNPRDKENKSETFLQLLQNAENEKEDQTFAFRAIASRYTRNSSTATSSNSHKQGGSLQDLVDAVRNESLLDCDYQFSVGGQRNRRNNHNSRQKKYSSVSSRQREGGSLPSNVNVTYCGGSNLLSSALDQQNAPAFIHEAVARNNSNNNNSSNSNSNNKHHQRRNKANDRTNIAPVTVEKDCESVVGLNNNNNNNNKSSNSSNTNDSSSNTSGAVGVAGAGVVVGTGVLGGVPVSNGAVNSACSRDFVIEMGEPMLDIQQSQQILQAKGQDAATQGLPFYDRLDNIDLRIPRSNVISSLQTKTEFAPANSQCYVDEAVRFTTLERGGELNGSTATGIIAGACGQNKVSSSTIETKELTLDENYKSCRSVLAEKTEIVKTPSAMFSTTKTITRQFDENGNSFNDIYQKGAAAAAAILNATGGGTSSIVSQSQAKAKNKKKSQQERNTKTVDVKSVAGYRGNDPVEVLVKYIESTEDKQNDKSTSNSNKFNENSKKKERKKDKEKQHKMKKSNSLEELRSCSKMDVDELKTSAATTESNVIMRNKSGKNKNNSSSAADINKNYDNKDLSTTSTKATAASPPTAASTASDNNIQRKCERRSWGTEELDYLGDSNCNEEKTTTTLAKEKKSNKNKDRDHEKDEKSKDSITQEKTTEKQENKTQLTDTNTTTIMQTPPAATTTLKSERRKKSEGNMHPTTTTVTTINGEDVLAMDASLLPETAGFHMVTKKKKAKKQRASLDETNSSSNNYTGNMGGGFNRTTSNFMSNMQKSNNTNFATQRYKYYNQHATNNDYVHAYNNHANSNNSNYNNYNHRYNNTTNNNQNVVDKSRRKSTSSMPPSEKSDSSDLDSVHSLPIESTTGVATTALIKGKPRHKNTNGATATTATTAVNNSAAPVSYADIARTSKEQQLTSAPATIASPNSAASASATSASTASTSTTSTSANGVDKWPVVVDLVSNVNPTESTADCNNVEHIATAPTQAVGQAATTTTAAITTKHKTKKSATKSDFPELVATLSPPAATSSSVFETTKATNFKQISYSQSLTSVPQATAIVPSNTADPAVIVVDSSNREQIEKRHVAAAPSAIEIRKSDLSTQAANIHMQHIAKPQQFCQQQPLQKSKSVEHESYNYNYDSSNMDQQYPALEKTVKRHGTSTVAIGGGLGAYNLSASAKQQQQQQQHSSNAIDENVLTSTAPTTSTYNKNTSPNAATAIATTATAIALKKPKEKSKEAPATHAMLTHEYLSQNSSNASVFNSVRKTKKEKQQQQQHLLQNELTPYKSTTTATQTGATYVNNTNPSNSNSAVTVATASNLNSKKLHGIHCAHRKIHIKTHCLSKHSTSAAGGATTNTAATTNRPAVIILNDDRTVGGYTPNNEFTFGDFNEEELKFFDDEVISATTEVDDGDDYEENEVDSDNNNAGVTEYMTAKDQTTLTAGSSAITADGANREKRKTSSSTMATMQQSCFNDSGANFNITSASSSSSNCDMGVLNNSTQQSDELIMMSASDASSPNSSLFVLGGANQSSDSGIYTSNKLTKVRGNMKRITAINEVTNSCGRSNINFVESATENTNQASTFLNTSSSSSSSSSEQITVTNNNNNTSSSSPPRIVIKQENADGNCSSSLSTSQQLETCNDIETAIIAAARAAAVHQLQQQQQPICNSSSSASSSLSSSSSVSIESKYSSSYQAHQQQQQNHYHHYRHYHRHCSQQTDDEHLQYHQQQQQSYDRYRSRSNSSQREEVTGAQHKEKDLYFITPTTPSAMSSLQHNEIIIDFIGSAWEEVANSKVTKFYDGQ